MQRTRPDRGLRKLADETGGGYFELKKTDDLGPTFTRVAQELHSLYALGFAPTVLDGKEHKLEVRVKTAGATVRGRKSYVASEDRLSLNDRAGVRLHADRALEGVQRTLLADREGFEVELQNGVLQVVFEEPSPAKFVVSPNAPVRQIWVSAMSRSYKLAWSHEASAFALDGETLSALVERLTRVHLTP